MSSPETLLAESSWLRRLAAGLVGGDRALADDVTQDAWVAALHRPPDLDRPVRPWLARVVRNAARFRWRSDRHRAEREHAIAALADRATLTSEDLLARHRLQQLVARLVGELDEPFRTTVLLRYAEGLEPTEIARRLAIPASTVRGRLKTGLDRLRAELDGAHHGDRKAWLLALAPLALWRRAHAAPAGGAGLALAALALLVIVGIGGTGGSPPAPAVVPARAAPSTTARGPLAVAAVAGRTAQQGAPARHVAGRVVRDGVAVAGARVRLTSEGAEPLEQRAGADGRFDFGSQPAHPVTLGAAAPDTLAAIAQLDLRDPGAPADRVELPLAACVARAYGTVSDADGTPIAGAEILREDAIGAQTDAAGGYELCLRSTAALVPQLEVVVRADGYGAIALAIAPDGRVRHDFVLTPEAVVAGRALGPGGPVAGARIRITPERAIARPTDERPAELVAVTDADGRFRIAGASGGAYRLGGDALGAIATPMLFTVDAAATTELAVSMIDAAIVRGRVLAAGEPVAGARVAIAHGDSIVAHDAVARDPIAGGDAVTQADGTFVVDAVPVGDAVFTAAPMRVASPGTVALVAGDHNAVELDTEPLAALHGVVRRHGAPVPFARIDARGPSTAGTTADAAGRYALPGLLPGRYQLYADDGNRGAYATPSAGAIAVGDPRDVDIELAWDAQIAGTVVDAAGQPLAGVGVRWVADTAEDGRCTTDARGAFACGRLVPGTTYQAAVYPGDATTAAFPFIGGGPVAVRAGDPGAAGVRLAVDARVVAITGRVVDEQGEPIVDAGVRAHAGELYNAWLAMPTVATDGAGRFALRDLAPGTYTVEADTLDGERHGATVIVGGATDITLVAAPARCAPSVVAPGEPATRAAPPIVWDDRIALIGWTVPATARAGQPVDITLVFRALAPITRGWQLFAHFDGPLHRVTADHVPAAGTCPTTAWQPGDTIVDRFTAVLPAPGAVALAIGWFTGGGGGHDGAPWQNLALSAAGDAAAGIPLGTIDVTP